MQNFQDTFEARKRPLIGVISICMTAPLSLPLFKKDVYVRNSYFYLTRSISIVMK